MDQRAQSIVWSSMQRILHGFVQQEETILQAGDRGYAALACSGFPLVHSATHAQQAWNRSLAGSMSERPCSKPSASPWIGCSSSARSHLVRNTFRLLQGIAALHLQFRCMMQTNTGAIQIPSPRRASLSRELPTDFWLGLLLILLVQWPVQSGLCGLFPSPRM